MYSGRCLLYSAITVPVSSGTVHLPSGLSLRSLIHFGLWIIRGGMKWDWNVLTGLGSIFCEKSFLLSLWEDLSLNSYWSSSDCMWGTYPKCTRPRAAYWTYLRSLDPRWAADPWESMAGVYSYFYWSITDLQCVSFCWAATWISYVDTYSPSFGDFFPM